MSAHLYSPRDTPAIHLTFFFCPQLIPSHTQTPTVKHNMLGAQYRLNNTTPFDFVLLKPFNMTWVSLSELHPALLNGVYLCQS